jgi:hypothetical protein
MTKSSAYIYQIHIRIYVSMQRVLQIYNISAIQCTCEGFANANREMVDGFSKIARTKNASSC